MASSDVLELDALVQPISPESPAGVDLRNDPQHQATYHAARDARSSAGRREREAMGSGNPADLTLVPDEWRTLRQMGPEILSTTSKHLEIAAWLTEALVRLDGFPGLRDGLRLMHALVETFWDDLYPRPDPEDGIEARVFPLSGLNGVDGEGTLVQAIRRVPITAQDALALWQYTGALNLERLAADERQARINEGAVSLEAFKSAALESGVDFYETLSADVNACLDAFTALTASLDARCGPDSPPSSNIKSVLVEIRDLIGSVAPKREVIDGDGAEGDGGSGGPGAAPRASGPIRSREQAFSALLDVAKFFEQTEPHSPVSFALRQTVRWGQMSLPDLWSELITDKGKRDEVFRLIGVKGEEK